MPASSKKSKRRLPFTFLKEVKTESARGIGAILFFVLAALLLLGAGGGAGMVGNRLVAALTSFFGLGYAFVPILSTLGGIFLLRSFPSLVTPLRLFGATLFFLAGLGLLHLTHIGSGGFLGKSLVTPLIGLFDFSGALIILVSMVIIALIIVIDTPLAIPFPRLPFFSRREREENFELGPESPYEESAYEETPVDEPRVTPPPKEAVGVAASFTIPKVLRGAYQPPPLSLLEKDRGKPGVGDIKANANLIKRTLQNFGIHVEMDEISIGPTVTRYTLKPAEGVRLSKIIGLQNNLELALAAHPVRIEAPIPGKSLVGVEVPNSAKATVGLGTLLSAETFHASAKPLLIV